jgi:hypothetical protein
MSSLKIDNWGSWKIAWVQSSDIQGAVNAVKEGKVDGLGISSYHGFSGKDISFLDAISDDVTGLIFPRADDFNIAPIEKFKNLRHLVLTDPKQSLDLSQMMYLEDLSLDWLPQSKLPDAKSPLRRLHLRRYKAKDHDLSQLPSYPHLETLGLVLGNLTSLAGVERFRSLKNGDFSYLTKLESIKDLAKTPVETLVFDACKKAADDLPSLSKCPHLKMLGFHGGGELESLKFLNSFKTLEDFRFVRTKIKDGDMTPLLKLKSVNFINQRGYSHTSEQIREMIGAPPFIWDQTKGKSNSEA